MIKVPPCACEILEKALLLFIRKECEHAGFSDVVLGLSGGLDSAVSAALAVKALGKEHVTALLMPWEHSSPSSKRDALTVAHALGIETHVIDITPMVEAFEHSQTDKSTLFQSRLGNVMARVRMIHLFDFSLAHRALVLGTSNKSEIALGYSTLFGDIASAINPLGDIYKTDVFLLGAHLNLPAAVVAKPPSADLWEGQTDEEEIGYSYAQMDPILYGLLEMRLTADEIVALGADEHIVSFVEQRLNAMHFKRKIPIIAKVSNRSFGGDYLMAKDFNG